MEIEVYNIKGKKTSRKVTLDDSIYAIEPNDHVIYLDVKQHLGNKRQGTHKAKERSELSGSTRKLRKQKGSGMARVGDINSPVLRGGARVFGPRPKDYTTKLNKKTKKLARKSALTYKVKDNQFFVLEDFVFDTPKTKNYLEVLANFDSSDKKTLLVLSDSNKNVYLSSRNLKKAKVVSASDINTYDILNAQNILVVESSLKKIEEVLKD